MLQQSTNVDTGFRRCGGWYLADTPGERAAMIGMTAYWNDLEIQCEQVDLADVAWREKAISKWTLGRKDLSAWWTPDECQVRSPDFLSALKLACLKRGVKVVDQFEVRELNERPGHVSILGQREGSENFDEINADVLVVCAGPWTGKIAAGLNLEESIVPIRGQVLMFKSDSPPLGAVVNVGNRYLVSRDDGHTLVGSCEEEVGWQLGTTDAVLDRLRRFAKDVCPELNNATEVKSWSGLRPMTFDGFPMIGPVPDMQRVFVASGHYRSGIHLAPATAVALADAMTGQSGAIDLQPFSVGKQQTKHTP
jgi:glycine oxidase